MQAISVFEHQPLRLGEQGFTEPHRQALECFLGNNDETTFPYYTLINKGVKFRHYVGVLCVNDLTIEILPKTDRDNRDEAYWRRSLLHMLSKVYKLDVKAPSDALQKTKTNSPILDVFIKRFLDEVDSLLNRGLVKCYHKEEDNRKALKGKLLIGEQLRRNFIHKERFFVRYNTYDFEHIMNCLLRQAIEVAAMATQNVYLRGRAISTLFNFPELKEVTVTPELFENLIFDRKTEDYRMAIKLAKLLLTNSVPNRVGKGDRILALMFDMNKLWEEYVYIMLRRYLEDFEVRSQEFKHFWQQEDGTYKTIRPDIVIRKDNQVVAILDTKWKCPDKAPSDGDLHQMYVYSKLFDTSKVGLVYPSIEEIVFLPAHFLDKKSNPSSCCDMLFFSLIQNNGRTDESIRNTREWLKKTEKEKVTTHL